MFVACARRKALSIVVAVTATIALAAAAPAAAKATAKSTLHWTACDGGFRCATLTVPLDYDHPHGAKISLALVKLPATNPAHRIGSLFINPGGPGGSGVDAVEQAGAELFTPQVRARFDIVGFDPRGIGRSTPLLCFDSGEEADAALAPFPYPDTPANTRIWIASDRNVERHCADQGGSILNHMATADAARDLDRMRAAVGDQGLTYYGVSYGSFLGNTYANLFPGRVRAVALDGVLNPVEWTTGRGNEGSTVPFSTRLHSAVGAQATLSEFFRLCNAGRANCALAPHAATRFHALLHHLRKHPVPIENEDGSTFLYDETFLISDTLGAMYDSSQWPDFAGFLAFLETQASPSALGTRLAGLHRLSGFADYFNYVEGFPGVACSDSVNPRSPAAWIRAAAKSARTDGLFGPAWTWATSICARWPGHDSDRYLGPFTHRTANPVLLVGNLFDPATPYFGAQAVSRMLPNSRLLTVHAWAHTSTFQSTCATAAIAHYLLTSHPPAKGTVCNQDVVPFTEPAPSSAHTAKAGASSRAISAQLPWAAFR